MSSSSGNSSHSESGSPSEDRESYNYEIGPPSRKNQDYSSNSQYVSNSSSEYVYLNDNYRLESYLLYYAISKYKSTPYQYYIIRDLLGRSVEYRRAAVGKTGDELVNLRIQYMVLSKLLVLNYSRSEFRLVLAHYHLGLAYLGYECVEQAIEHLSIAMHKNYKMFNELINADLLQTYMLISLAYGLMIQGKFEDAIEMLGKSIELYDAIRKYNRRSERLYTDGKHLKAMVLQAQCLCKQKRFEESLKVIDRVIDISSNKRMGQIEHAFSIVYKANILVEMGTNESYVEAIRIQETAISNQSVSIDILVEENYNKPEYVAEMYSKLSEYFYKIGNSENALTCLQKVKTLYQELYSGEDKHVIKARRKIATSLLKSERFKYAVNELLEIMELYEKVFGENCIQSARTLKLLGTIYIKLSVGDARAYLKRAMTIFNSHGSKKQVMDIKYMLKQILDRNLDSADLYVKALSEQDL